MSIESKLLANKKRARSTNRQTDKNYENPTKK